MDTCITSLSFRPVLPPARIFPAQPGTGALMASNRNLTPKFIGVGLGRTGTSSLCQAMKILGFHTKHYMDYFKHLDYFDPESKTFQNPRLLEEYSEFQCIANGTGAPIQLIDEAFPGSKYILTIREDNAWLQSKRKSIEARSWDNMDYKTRTSQTLIRESIYGSLEFDEKTWLQSYRLHNSSVIDYFSDRPKDLLIFDIESGDGWPELCAFTGTRLPDNHFPHSNTISDVRNWHALLSTVKQLIATHINIDQHYILVDQGRMPKPKNAHWVIEHGGTHWGNPADGASAISSIRQLQQDGAEFIVFTPWCFWWLDHYDGLSEYLKNHSAEYLVSDDLKIYRLSQQSL